MGFFFQKCSSSRKLVIVLFFSSCYCFWAKNIVSVVIFFVLSKGIKPFTRDLTRPATWPRFFFFLVNCDCFLNFDKETKTVSHTNYKTNRVTYIIQKTCVQYNYLRHLQYSVVLKILTSQFNTITYNIYNLIRALTLFTIYYDYLRYLQILHNK